MSDCKHAELQTWQIPAGLWSCVGCGHKFVPLDIEQEKCAERYRWLRDNPLWSVSYRVKPRTGMKAWRMRDDGDYWGDWWPTHEQAVDHAMALDKAIAATRATPAVGAA